MRKAVLMTALASVFVCVGSGCRTPQDSIAAPPAQAAGVSETTEQTATISETTTQPLQPSGIIENRIRVVNYEAFRYGYSPDPVGEFLDSLQIVERLGARLCLAGHGRTFTDVHAHIHGNRALVEEHLYKVLQALAGTELTAFDVVGAVYGDSLSEQNGQWLLSQTLGYLTHLERTGAARRIPGEPERWTA